MNLKSTFFLAILTFAMLISHSSCAQKGKKALKESESTSTTKSSPEMDSVSYAFGVVLGNNLKNESIDGLDLEILKKGIEEVLNGTATLDNAAAGQMVNAHMKKAAEAKGENNKIAGEKFLEENKKKEGIITLESGLQYQVITEGTGPKPTAEDKVKTHYHGTLIDGTVFDSSVERGEPISFPVKGVIPGWTEALQLMPVGSKWKLFIPSDLAYGARGAGGKIGPNTTLIFDIELISIDK